MIKINSFKILVAGLICLLLDIIFFSDVGCQLAVVDPVSAAILAGGSLLGGVLSLFGSSSSSSAQREANANNMYMWRNEFDYTKQRDYLQRQMAYNLLSREQDFNQAEAIRQRLWQSNHDREMFGLSYDAQKEQAMTQYQWQRGDMEAAGLNPAMMFGGGNTLGMPSTPSAPSGSGVTATSPSMSPPSLTGLPSIPDVKPVTSQTPEMIRAISGSISDVVGAFKNSTEASSTMQKIQPEVDNLTEQINTLQSQQKVNEAVASKTAQEEQYTKTMNIIAEVQSKYADQKEFASLNKICSESQELIAKAYLESLQGETEKAKKLWNDAQTKLLELQGTQLEKSLPIIISNLKKQGDLFDAQSYAARRGADAQYQNAIASMIAAQAQDYLAHNPQTFEKWFVESMNSLGLSPEDLPSIAKKVEKLVTDNTPKALLKRAGSYVRDGIAHFLFGVPGYDARNQAQKQVQKYIDKK